MAINDIVQTIAEARVDARSLSEFVFKPASFIVTRRLASPIPTLSFYLNRFDSINSSYTDSITTIQAAVIDAENLIETNATNAKIAVNEAIISSGFVTIDSFELGATITQRNQALRHAADGKLYRWAGDLPKVVPASSTPASSGGISENAWLEVSDATLRQDIVTGGLVTDAMTKTVAKNFTGAVVRNQVSINAETLSVADFGVTAGVDEDKTAKLNIAFFAAREAGREIFVPDGVYRVDGTVTMESGGKVVFSSDATLKRFAAHSASVEPVFILRGSFTSSYKGRFITENNHPRGVISLGQTGLSDPNISTWWRCIHPFVEGLQAKGNIGVWIPSAQSMLGDTTVNFFGYLDNPVIRYCDEGIVFTEVSNSHTVVAPQFYQMVSSAISFYGAYANMITGGFLHTARDGVCAIKVMRARQERTIFYHHSTNNRVRDFGAEPGGASSKALLIENECTGNVIDITGNVSGGVDVANQYDNDYDTGFQSSYNNTNHAALDINYASGKCSEMLLEKRHLARVKSPKENTKNLFATQPIYSNHRYMYDVVVHCENGTLGSILPAKYTIVVSRGAGAAPTVVTSHNVIEGEGVAAKLVVEGNADDSLVMFYLQTINNGTNTYFSDATISIVEHVVETSLYASKDNPLTITPDCNYLKTLP